MGDVVECLMIVLPSPTAFDNEDAEYYDDYYLDLSLSCVEGKMYLTSLTHFFRYAPSDAPTTAQEQAKTAIATVHFKVSLL